MSRKKTDCKPRCDAWAAKLDEQQRWAIYFYSLKGFPVSAVLDWAMTEFSVVIPSRPSKTAFYDWLSWMRRDESSYRVKSALQAKAEIGELAEIKNAPKEVSAAFIALGGDMAMRGDVKQALEFIRCAASISEGERKRLELTLKARSEDRKDKELELSATKFEASEARLNAVREAIATAKNGSGGLTPEALKQIEEAAGLL